jgi:hypothetical protein
MPCLFHNTHIQRYHFNATVDISENDKTSQIAGTCQGDQIGRIFACRGTVFFGQCFENYGSSPSCLTGSSKLWVVLHFRHFFKSSSGHPGTSALAKGKAGITNKPIATRGKNWKVLLTTFPPGGI